MHIAALVKACLILAERPFLSRVVRSTVKAARKYFIELIDGGRRVVTNKQRDWGYCVGQYSFDQK